MKRHDRAPAESEVALHELAIELIHRHGVTCLAEVPPEVIVEASPELARRCGLL